MASADERRSEKILEKIKFLKNSTVTSRGVRELQRTAKNCEINYRICAS